MSEEFQAELVGSNEERVKLYFEFIQVVIDIMGVKKVGQQGKIKALAVKLQRIGLQMMVVASDEVVETFIKWRAIAMAGEPGNVEKVVETFADVIFAMRREIMGETARKPEDMFIFIKKNVDIRQHIYTIKF